MAEARRSSILKPPKQRAPLQEVCSLNIRHHDDCTTSTTVTQNMMRRVSFAGTSTIKEFDTQAESVLVCHTPAYEESFATSDSSVPSDHSSRFSSRSTISIDEQCTLPPFSDGASHQNVDPADLIFKEFGVEAQSLRKKSPPRRARFSIASPPREEDPPNQWSASRENPDPADLIFKEFGVEPQSILKKNSPRRTRFSITGPSDEDAPPTPTPAEKPIAAIPSISFYGKQNPKRRMSTVLSPRSQRLSAIDPFTLRLKAVNSPNSQSKKKAPGPPSPRSKLPLAKALFNPNESTSSEMDLTEAISGNIFVSTPSPNSVNSQDTPQSVLTMRSASNRSISEGTGTPTPGWKNKTVYESDMDMTRSIATSDEIKGAEKNIHYTIQNSMTMEFTQPVSSLAIRNEHHFVTKDKADGNSVACMSNSFVVARTAEGSVHGTVSLPEVAECNPCSKNLNKRSNTTMYDALDMDMTEAVSVPTTVPSKSNTTVSDPENMEFTRVISSRPVSLDDSRNARASDFIPRHLNTTVCDPEGMEFTRVNPGTADFSKELESSPKPSEKTLNQTLNDSMGMDFTEAIPSIPVLQNGFPVSIPELKTSNRTLNDSIGMDFTEAVPSMQDYAKDLTKGTSSVPACDPHITLCDSVDMELTRAVPAKQCSNSIETTGFPAHRMNITVCDSTGVEFTKVIHAPVLLNSLEVAKTSEHTSEETKYSSQVNKPPPIDCLFADKDNSSRGLLTEAESLQTSLQGSQPVTDTFHTTGDPSSLTESKLEALDEVNTSLSRLMSAPEPCVESKLPGTDDRRTSPIASSLRETSHSSSKLASPQKLQICRKRSIEEVEDNEQEESVVRKSRFNPVCPTNIPPSEIVIPSSRSPSPDELDTSARFPGLCQSFSAGNKTSDSLNGTDSQKKRSFEEVEKEMTSSSILPESGKFSDVHAVSTVTDLKNTPDSRTEISTNIPSVVAPCKEQSINIPVNPAPAVSTVTDLNTPASRAEISTDISPVVALREEQSINIPGNPIEPTTPPVNCAMPMDETESTNTPISATSEGVLRSFQTPDDYNFSISDKIKSSSANKSGGSFDPDKSLHKIIMDVSIPSIADISDASADQEVSSHARLYATLLEAENNVSIFHKEQEVEVPMDEESKCCVSREAEEPGNCGRADLNEENNTSVCEEPEKEEIEEQCNQSSTSEVQAIENKSLRSLPSQSVVPDHVSFCWTERDKGTLLNKFAVTSGTSRMDFALSRPAKEIIKAHWSEYRKQARCNWTSHKLKDDEWRFSFLDNSVELRINIDKSSRTGALSGWNGRFTPLIDDKLHGVWYIGRRLLYQKLSTEEWTSRIQNPADVLRIVEDVNLVANDVEKLITTLAYLVMRKNIEVTHDWICFDVLSQKTRDRWFKVKVDCQDLVNIKPQHVTIENIVGETRETDIQNLVTCVKKNAFFFKNYVAVVEEYLQTIERVK